MKKVILIIGFLITAFISNAQKRNKTYSLLFIDTIKNGQVYLGNYGLEFRNDTLYIGLNSPATILNITDENGKNICIPLRPIREKKDTTNEKNTIKKNKPETKAKNRSQEKPNKGRSQIVPRNMGGKTTYMFPEWKTFRKRSSYNLLSPYFTQREISPI